MAKVNSKSANGNSVATGKKFSYKELLAKAMGTTPEKVTVSTDVVKGVDDLYKKTMDKINAKPDAGLSLSEGEKRAKERQSNRTANEILAEVEEEILERENSEDDAEDIEIIEIVPVKGKKVIAQNSAQAQKLLSTKDQEAKPEMTDEEKKLARRKEISAIALDAKRAKKAQAEANTTVAPEPKEVPAPVVRTRTNNPKPAPAPEPKASNPVDDVLNSFINKGKSKERRTTLNSLLVEHKGLTLEKIEESTGKLNDAEVEELISKFNDIKASTKGKEEKAKPATRNRTVPPKKTSITRAETYSLALKNDPSSLEEWAKMADEIFVEGEGKSNLNQAMADVKWLSKFYLHYTGETFPTK